MATMHVNAVLLKCDGCDAQLLGGQTFPNPVEARGAAYGEGWRFPPQLSRRTLRPTKATSDVCSTCLPGWKPQVRGARAGYRRQDAPTS